MAEVNGTAYKLLGYTVWHGGKWYLGRRLPSARSLALSGLAAAGALGALAVIGRRVST
ncbi:MAG TPA: hypothetical protein VII03_02915 [Solirubrobacteraceae bacterium]